MRSIHFLPLAYLEQVARQRQVDINTDWRSLANRNLANTPLPASLCPSVAAGSRTRTFTAGASNGGGTLTRYVADYMVFCRNGSTLNTTTLLTKLDPGWTGALRPNVLTRMAQITDGTSNTLTFMEAAGGPQLYLLNRPVSGTIANTQMWADHRNYSTLDGSIRRQALPMTPPRPAPCARWPSMAPTTPSLTFCIRVASTPCGPTLRSFS
ncbi:MAG TPA: DUF1559 domain-containing protein [Pirellulales bacterium]